jgi:alpha-tubulin suppressor-like RCC1 family protein
VRLWWALGIALAACSSVEPRQNARAVYISDDGVVLAPGDTIRFGLTWEDGGVTQQSGIDEPMTLPTAPAWQSRAPSVALVDPEGVLTAVSTGGAKISLVVDGVTDSGSVDIRAPSSISSDYAAVAPGFIHTCALTTDGRPWCWGSNWFGQLGIGFRKRFTAFPSPRPVYGDKRFNAIASGAFYSCGVEVSGTLFCWGNRGGPAPLSTLDAVIPTPVAPNVAFVAVTAGSDHTCALSNAGVAYCWGLNTSGQLGNGTRTNSAVPAKVQVSSPFIQVSAGDRHTCALTAAHEAYCWGDNTFGELGTGTVTSSTTPVPVASDVRFAQIAAGTESTCAISDDSTAYCWGENVKGKLGTGDDIARATPTSVLTAERFVGISTRLDHTCSLNLSGRAYCWGDNTWGELGNGVAPGQVVNGSVDPYSQMTPVSVNGDRTYVAIAAGSHFSCGVTSDAEMWCWGSNALGKLGSGRRRVPAGVDYKITTPMETEPQIVRRP